MIYFIKAESGHVKIGYSKNNPIKRLEAIQTSKPYKLTLLKAIDGDHTQEWLIHLKFDSFRVMGEWFLLTDAILEFIESPYKIVFSSYEEAAAILTRQFNKKIELLKEKYK